MTQRIVVGFDASPAAAAALTSRTCLGHAPCHVVVVRPQPKPMPSRGRVFVGVDMSGHSRTALLFAAPS